MIKTRKVNMKTLARIILSVALVVPVHANAPPAAPSESQFVGCGSYTNRDGVRVHSPAHAGNGEHPEGASALRAATGVSQTRHASVALDDV